MRNFFKETECSHHPRECMIKPDAEGYTTWFEDLLKSVAKQGSSYSQVCFP